MKKINLILGGMTLLCIACNSDDNGNSQTLNQPPSDVILISPTNNQMSVDKNVTFVYDVPNGDPDGDTITYDIYLNNGIEEQKIAENYEEVSFTYNQPLGLNRTYTWYVVAKDFNGGETTSETFSFKTRKANYESLSANFVARDFHRSVLFNNQLVILGGRNSDGVVFNSRSSNDGVLWSPIPIYPEERRNHTAVVFDSKLWVFGGINSTGYVNSIYNISDISSDSGEVWNAVENTVGLLPRINHTQVVLNDKMYIIGGQGELFGFSDVWSSPNGETWQLKNEDAPFGSRYHHTSVAFDNKIWVIGGTDGNTFNDVWFSENGTDWILATEHAQFTARTFHSSVVYDDKIWVYGGFDDDDNTLGDLWYSDNGINWYEAKFETGTGQLPVGLTNASLVVKDDIMYVIGGRDNTGTFINYIIKIQ